MAEMQVILTKLLVAVAEKRTDKIFGYIGSI